MKKCPYCAEEIQEEAIFCRYCNHDLIEKTPETVIETESYIPSTPETKKPKNPFWIALGVGLFGGAATWTVRSQRGIEFPEFGYSGFFNDLVMGTITSILLWGLFTSLIIWFWRVAIRQTPGIKSFSQDSGCVSGVFFFSLTILIGYYAISNTDGEKLTKIRNTIATDTLIQATQLTTEPEIYTENEPAALYPTKTPIRESWEFQTRLDQLVSSGYLLTTYGDYYRMPDFNESFAQIDYYQWYRLPGAPTNFIIRTEASWESASATPNLETSGCGFAFHEQDEDHYMVFLGMDGTARMRRVQNNQIMGTWDKFYRRMEIPVDSAELLLLVNNNRFTFMINGETLLDVIDDKIPTGALGITIHSGTNKDFGVRCIMKNVEVIELP